MNRIHRVTLRVLACYLAFSGAVCLILGASRITTLIAAVHFGSSGVLWMRTRLDKRGGWSVSWLLPILLLPVIYGELGWMISTAGLSFRDQALLPIERLLFGGMPSHTLAGSLPIAWLSEMLHACYLSYYLLIVIPPITLALMKSRHLPALVLGVTVAYCACFALSLLFTIEGPRYLLSAPPAIPDGVIRRIALFLLEQGSSRGAAFPSSHVAIATVTALVSFRVKPLFGIVTSLLAFGIAFGAVYGGFHYGIDVVAGAVVGVLSAFFTLRVEHAVSSRAPRTTAV